MSKAMPMPTEPKQPGKGAWLMVLAWLAGCTLAMWVYNPITVMDLASVCRSAR